MLFNDICLQKSDNNEANMLKMWFAKLQKSAHFIFGKKLLFLEIMHMHFYFYFGMT